MNAPLRVCGLPMIRISQSYIFEVATTLEPLGTLPDADTPYSTVWLPFLAAQGELERLYSQTLYAPYLRASAALAAELSRLIKAQTDNQDFQRTILRFQLWEIRNAYGKFKIALLAELAVLHSYFVTQKGGFDTVSLLAFGENLFPIDLATKVPEAIFDAREAGKCLAY